jgi:hypothetical protein
MGIGVRLRMTGKPPRSVRLGMDIRESDVALAAGQSNDGHERVGGIHVSEQRIPGSQWGLLRYAHRGIHGGQKRGEV